MKPAIGVHRNRIGAAISAGVATGAYSSYEQATDMVVRKERQFEPDPKRAAFYRDRLPAYRELYSALKQVQRKLPED